MNQLDINEQLKLRFARPLSDFDARRVVVWHDPDGEFEEDFDKLAAEGFDGAGVADGVMPAGGGFPRNLRFLKAEEGVMFLAKKLIARDDVENDILLYRKRGKGKVEGDWLADVELYAESFQADRFSLLATELGASNVDAVRDALRGFQGYFASKARIKKFHDCMPEPSSAEDVEVGVLAALLGAAGPEDASVGFIVRGYMRSLLKCRENPADAFDPFAKYGADEALSNFVARKTGFTGALDETSSLEALASHVLVSAASFVLPDGALSGLERCISKQHAPFCLSIVRDWDRSEGAADLYEVARIVEESCGLPARFAGLPLDDIVDCDVLPCINEAILGGLMVSLADGADRAEEAHRVCARRKDLAWHNYVACYFDALDAAASLCDFRREHAGGFHVAQAKEVWRAYETDWYRADSFYRRLCHSFELCKTKPRPALEGPLRSVVGWAENLYSNWYIEGVNACWENAASSQWASAGYIEGVPRERRFYWEVLPSCKGSAKNAVVVISDALRFEVAAQMARVLERERGSVVALSSMQAVFPSVTEFGMAALLPQRDLSLDWETGAVFANGMPTATTSQREAVLRATAADARALRVEDFLDLPAEERKALVKGASVVYLYHNKIDSTGEKIATEDDVFKACADEIDSLCALARRLTSEVQGCQVTITADHGFLYTRGELRECGSLDKGDMPLSPVVAGKRHIVARADDAEWADSIGDPASTLFVEMNMSDVSGGRYTGLAPHRAIRIKQPGGTRNYVHGGLTLQELCVPVLSFRRVRSGAKGFRDTQAATIRVLSESRRITNSLFNVSLLQEEPAAGKVLPCEYELVFLDSSGNEVSDVVKAHADLTSDNPQDRVIKVRFSLKAGCSFISKEAYYLVARDKSSGVQVWREKYRIEVAFAPVDDFGW